MGFSVTGLKKAYDGVPVLRGVDLAVKKGEIHALLGANGAGKSTLINCLVGAVVADSGEIRIGDDLIEMTHPRDAKRAGIEVVHQQPSLAGTLNVSENIHLGRELKWGPFLRRRHSLKVSAQWLTELGMNFSPTGSLGALGNADLQMIEIAKALSGNPKMLVLDEPTAALTDAEQRELATRLRDLRRRDIPILYVTHRLSEVFEIADTVTVLWGGKVALSKRVSEVSESQLVEAIVTGGPSKGTSTYVARTAVERTPGSGPQRAMLEVTDLTAPRIGPISFDLRPGEILGVYGLVGSGRTELLEALGGAEGWVGGAARLDGKAFAPVNPHAAVGQGVALVPSDRLRKSMFPTLTALENSVLPTMRNISRAGLRNRRKEQAGFLELSAELKLHPMNPSLEAKRFSGGNQQKLVLSRWMTEQTSSPIKVLLLDEPTEGVDVGARRDLYRMLEKLVQANASAIVASSEPEELMQVADRVLVLSGGKAATILEAGEMSVRSMIRFAHFNENGD